MCGLGQWGPNLLRNLRSNSGFQVAALCDRDEIRLREFQSLHPEASFATEVEEIAADSTIQAAVVATPAGLHAEHVRLLLESGKDVLVEKPLARTSGRILMVGHTFLFNPAVRRVKEEISKGTLGELDLVLAQRMSLGHIRTDCNALWNLAPHDVSILLYWLGTMPVSVSARGLAVHERHVQEDIALCVLQFPGRVMASLQVSWMNPVKVRQMTLVGRKRMLVYDDVSQEAPLTLYDQAVEEVARRDPEGSFEGYRLQIRRGPSSVIPVEAREPLAVEVQHFLDCIRSRREPLSGGEEALRVISVLEALDRSIKRDGEPVEPVRV
jgi:predicted dehydrogenase